MVPDEKDKRKQRIVLTEKCLEFCQNNEQLSQDVVGRIFEGIDEKKLMVTIETIMEMERNLGKI